MATVKIKFRPSSVDGREGTVYYQVIHGRVARQINTSCKLFPAEWSKRHSRIVIASSDEDRRQYLLLLDKKIAEDTDRLENIITALERKGGTFTADDVTSAFYDGHCGLSFSVFMREVTNGLKRLGKIRTSETYTSTLNSFMRFMEGRDIPPCDMDSDLMIAYEAWLKSGGVSMNTISFYMRNLRAIYNRAVERELTARWGEEYDDDGETLTIPEGTGEVNVAWNIYEFISLEVPMRHVHPEGECHGEVEELLEQYGAEEPGEEQEAPIDERWSELKKILDNN